MYITLFVIALALSTIITSALAIYGWRFRQTTGALSYVALMVAATIWTVSAFLSAISPNVAVANFWGSDIRFIGIVSTPVIYLLFVLEYTGRTQWLSPKYLGLYFVIPAITLILNWTNESHHLFREFSTHTLYDGRYYFQNEWTAGPWFWVHLAYSYGALTAALGLLLRYAIQSTYPYRQQALLFLLAFLLPLIANIPVSFKILAEPTLDLTLLGTLPMGVLIGVSLFRYRFLDIMPVARDAIFESMNDAVVVLDTQNRVVDINPAAEKVLDRNRYETLGQPAKELFAAYAEIVDRFKDMPSTKAEVSTPEGQTFHLQISTIYRRQQPAGRIIVLHNITERKLAEEEREKLIDDLNAYAHTVAHDLKNPIGLINSSVQFIDLKFKPEVSEPFAERLNVIEQTSRKMVNIVDELLVLASVRNQDTIEKSVLDMPIIVEGALKRLEPVIEKAGARIIQPESWQPGLGYGPWVEEIWANYISNALKYGGQPPVIEVGSERVASDMVRFWVKDNGNGMTPQECEKLFMQFTRLPQHLKAEGQGLGLSIVKRIAEKLGGDVGVESEIGQGSRFYFTLPLAPQLEKERL